MNKLFNPITLLASFLAVITVEKLPAQGPGGIAGAPGFSASLTQIFGDHKAFSADMLVDTSSSRTPMVFPGKLNVLDGKARIEFDLSKAKGAGLPPQASAQLKAMGMSETILLLNGENSYLVYPGLKSYAPMPTEGSTKPEDFKITRTDLGKETLENHPCKKQKVLIQDPDGKEHSAIVWAATDMKDFPIVIEFDEGQRKGKMKFENVSFEKPAAKLFTPSPEFTKHASMQELMASMMRKQFGGQQP